MEMKLFDVTPLNEHRREACESLMRSLPDWFQIESSIREISKEVDQLETFAARRGKRILGLLVLKRNSAQSAEIFFMGVQPNEHRKGIGRALLEAAEDRLRVEQVASLEVKTLGPSRPDEGYERTRRFYLAMGFQAQDESLETWGPENPCLTLVKKLG